LIEKRRVARKPHNMYEGESESDLLARAEEEREQIVARYKLGRAETQHIDDWEDPKFELHHVLDRYGFIHDKRLPDTKDRTDREKKQIQLEVSRSGKWAEMFSEEKKYFPEKAKNREKMINRVFKGVPDSVRGKLWNILLDLETVKIQHKGTYERMLQYALSSSPHIRQIDLDVNRTYRDHIFFRERYNQRQQALFYVLAAYSVYNTEVGYCQGMSQIAALLLMYLTEEEDAFWALSQLMAQRKYAMHGFFIPGFPKLIRFQAHHDRVLKKFLPKLKKHMDKNGIDTSIYTLKWFFQCFLDRIPFSLALRVWDLYILEGECILTAMSYNILRMHRRHLKTLDMDRLIEELQQTMGVNFGFEDGVVIERLREVMYELRSNRLHSPGNPPSDELAKEPFGLNVPEITKHKPKQKNRVDPQELGIRTEFSEKEREYSQYAMRRQAEVENGLLKSAQSAADLSTDEDALDNTQESLDATAADANDAASGRRSVGARSGVSSRSGGGGSASLGQQPHNNGTGGAAGGGGGVSFDPAGTSSPKSERRSLASSAAAAAPDKATPDRFLSECDEATQKMLEMADLNGDSSSVMNTSANSMLSSASLGAANQAPYWRQQQQRGASSQATNPMDTSYDSVGGLSQASNRSDVVRVRVPYTKEDAIREREKSKSRLNSASGGGDQDTSPKYDGNKIRINVNHGGGGSPDSQQLKNNSSSSASGGGGGGSSNRLSSPGLILSNSQKTAAGTSASKSSEEKYSYASQSLNRYMTSSSSGGAKPAGGVTSSKSDKQLLSTSLEGTAAVSVSRYEKFEQHTTNTTSLSSSYTKRSSSGSKKRGGEATEAAAAAD